MSMEDHKTLGLQKCKHARQYAGNLRRTYKLSRHSRYVLDPVRCAKTIVLHDVTSLFCSRSFLLLLLLSRTCFLLFSQPLLRQPAMSQTIGALSPGRPLSFLDLPLEIRNLVSLTTRFARRR